MDDIAGRKVLIESAGLKDGRILDVGMGDCGCMSFFLARRGFDVVGIDRSPKAIHDSRKDAEKIRFKGRFKARLADAENLPFGDSEFDAVFSYHSMHHMDKAKKVIKEMFRVCRSKGLVLVADFNERGRKKYKHKLDGGSFLKKIEGYLIESGTVKKKIETKYTALFICQKKQSHRRITNA